MAGRRSRLSFVLDASFAAAWLLPEEHSAAAKVAIGHAIERLTVPSIFWDEARNIVLIAERRSRIGAGEAVLAIARLRRLPLQTIDTTGDGNILTLASTHRLTAYDAAYLDVAISLRRPMATLDRSLASAAHRSSVGVLGPYA